MQRTGEGLEFGMESAGQDSTGTGNGRPAAGEYDVVVIGGGAAGLSGALALARARRTVLVVDAGEPRNAPASHVHNYLGQEGAPPAELYAAGRQEVLQYGAEIVQGRVETVGRIDGGGFSVRLASGDTVRACRILAATGGADRLPDVEGVREHWGTGVLHCPYCHGWEVRDKEIGILAVDMATAVHQALMWRQWSEHVALFLHTAGTPDAEQAEQLAARGIRVVEGEVIRVEGPEKVTGLRLASGALEPCDAVVVFTRVQARAGYLAGVGLEAVEQFAGEIPTGTAVPVKPNGATEVPGVYAAGNVAEPMVQVIASAAAGMSAGAAINMDLITEDIQQAVESAARSVRSG
ncbi:NAD(P)/FAD-dependent oxidoreductase [Arthrobacter caoxuetaonis]|uniref:NAD(P)/FAD-dependent oxidoreductase n=1 Tax=Arthrobacter caoxuetaonis TaxID=2886935 RepID=A0A9X1SFY6_9MICC|nr:NAD(P)/FAD-dependent oxidoreductase [Arthrobacter caoxuetaonis]MCC3298964.1 NAD(P)/FAD-dependent oxidoreductase [Arthrobacter caoxuetaonis]USQ58695.1 NAD(P)/FAD-dependent oxidoreductase [Arthrobacter caoxuetaonis]